MEFTVKELQAGVLCDTNGNSLPLGPDNFLGVEQAWELDANKTYVLQATPLANGTFNMSAVLHQHAV